MSTITVKNAVKKFKNSTVIDNVSLTLEGGNIYGFVETAAVRPCFSVRYRGLYILQAAALR